MVGKIFTYGCSVSSYYSTSKTYTDYISDILKCESVNFSMTCGSNDRSLRLVNNHILDNTITSNDLILFQYTSPERKEFWSKHLSPFERKLVHKNDVTREDFKNGQIFPYKMGVYGDHEIEKKITKLYEDNFVEPQFDAEHLRGRHAGLLALCQVKNIPIVFISGYANQMFLNWEIVEDPVGVDRFMDVNFKDMRSVNKYLPSLPDGSFDISHFNEEGHKEISNRIFRILKENNLA